jgi:hypothetical protein
MNEPSGRGRHNNRWALSMISAVAGGLLVAGGLALGVAGGQWLAASPALAVGLFLVAVARPSSLREAHEEGERTDLFPNEIGELRVRCPCCGCPSLDALTPDQSCIMCEWMVDGLPAQEVQETEELVLARQNFRRFLSVYAPAGRPEWSPDPLSDEELALKQELLSRYAAVLREDQEAAGIWRGIAALERRARELEAEYSAQVESEAAESPELEADDDAEPQLPPAAAAVE